MDGKENHRLAEVNPNLSYAREDSPDGAERGFLYGIFEECAERGGKRRIATASLVVCDTSADGDRRGERHGFFVIDLDSGDGPSERIFSFDYGADWRDSVDGHIERHLMEMALELVDRRISLKSGRLGRMGEFVSQIGFPFAVEETGLTALGEPVYSVVTLLTR